MAELDSAYAAVLRQPRARFVTETPDGASVLQAGAAYVGERFEVPTTPFEITGGEPAIETFVVCRDQPISPTGENHELITLWQPAAQRMADIVMAACNRHGIDLVEPGYLTGSALPLDQVSHEPHFDDDHFDPADGASLVAIAATHGGTRTTTTPIEVASSPPGTPLVLPDTVQDRFDRGEHPSVESEQGRIVIFPQFGQVHAGPILPELDQNTLRTLFVLRFKTAGDPEQARPQRRRRTR
ncbi:MAG: hypothetical protein HKN24_11865 [Acidimicrobiales bacterium]|nr:hypothetical protein [Acidimicrobiales bacterium]